MIPSNINPCESITVIRNTAAQPRATIAVMSAPEDLARDADEQPSRLSIALGRLTLSAGRYPLRRQVGFMHRKISRERGGRHFVVETSDGISLDAWYSPARANTPDRLPVVIAHGLMETKERHFKRAWKLNARGHDCVLFDHRVHGRSSGTRLTFGVSEKLDMKAVIDDAVRRKLIGPKVITMGFSLGGGVVLQHAAIDPRVVGVVALAPFGDFTSAIESFRKTLTPWLDPKWVNDGFVVASAEAGFEINEASALEAIEQVVAPLLLCEGGKDPFLPGPDHVRRLAARKPGHDLSIVTIDEASHNTLVHKSWPKLDRAIARFCQRVSEES